MTTEVSVCEEVSASSAADWDTIFALTGLIINCLLIACNVAVCYNNLI